MATATMDAATAVSHGRVVGVIIPPPDVRSVVDVTATYVAKQGRTFEARVAATAAGSNKFAFLKTDSPYHAYYLQKIAEFSGAAEGSAGASGANLASGTATPTPVTGAPPSLQQPNVDPTATVRASVHVSAASGAVPLASDAPRASETRTGDDVSARTDAKADVPNDNATSVHARAASAVLNPLAAALRGVDLSKPITDEYTLPPPSYASPVACATVSVCAAACAGARSGKAFLTSLAGREYGSSEFDFLRPSHALFGYFTALVDVYARVLDKARSYEWIDTRVPALPGEPSGLTALRRARHVRVCALTRIAARMEAARTAAEDGQEDATGSSAAQQIDWSDFTLVERITFEEAEDASLPSPPPMPSAAAERAAARGRAADGAFTQLRTQAPAAMRELSSTAAELRAAAEAALREGAAAHARVPGNVTAATGGVDARGAAPVLAGPRFMDIPRTGAAAPAPPAAVASADMDMDVDMDEDEPPRTQPALPAPELKGSRLGAALAAASGVDEELRIVNNYAPHTHTHTHAASNAALSFYDPRSGRNLPVASASDQIRVELMDPRARDQQAVHQSRVAALGSSLASGDAMAANLTRLAGQRDDIFGGRAPQSTPAVPTTVGPAQVSAGVKRPRSDESAS